MDSQVRECGFISLTTVEGTSVTTVEQLLGVEFAALAVTQTTQKKIMSVTEAHIDC